MPLNDLWLDADDACSTFYVVHKENILVSFRTLAQDTDAGVRIFTMEASESSARILDRKERVEERGAEQKGHPALQQDKTGERTPYYEAWSVQLDGVRTEVHPT